MRIKKLFYMHVLNDVENGNRKKTEGKMYSKKIKCLL